MAIIFMTQISEAKWFTNSTAPNGSSSATDYYTAVVSLQDWADVPENGVYRGRTYKITETYISNDPNTRGQLISRSSSSAANEG
jgi:hypothetical protein